MTMIDIDIFRKIQSSDYYTTYEFWNTDSLKTLCLFFFKEKSILFNLYWSYLGD